MTRRLSVVAPCPAPYPLPDSYERRDPAPGAQREVLDGLVGGTGWAALSWPDLVERLLALGRTDVPLSRLAEGHVDAHRILAQAGVDARPGLYGVWASRSARTGVRAVAAGTDGALRIAGTLRFASGAGLLDRALVPVWLDETQHVLLDLDVAGLPYDPSVWRTAAMRASRTWEVRVDETTVGPEARVGPPGFYLERPGFAAGGVGVAACWAGGVARVLDVLLAAHPSPSPAQQVRFGRLRTDLVAAVATVRAAAVLLDRPDTDPRPVALETRSVVAAAVGRVCADARLLTGPTGLALDDAVAAAVPDLELYALQHHADGAFADLGVPERLP